jgi:hypothetical protein
MVALKSGDTTPENWIPPDVAAYMTVHWDIRQTYEEMVRLVEIFQGEGAWQERLDFVSDRLEIDFERDVVDAIGGRGTLITWMERPPRLNSQATLIGVKLKDADRSRMTLERVLKVAGNRVQKDSYGGVTFWRVDPRNRNRQMDAETTRIPEPCIAMLGDYIVGSDSVKLLQQAIIAKSDASQSLANELDYKLIASKTSRLLGDTKAGMVSFSRPEESMRNFYELANSPSIRARLRDGAQNNPALRALNAALTDNPLPPFAVIAQYLAPGGAMVTSDTTGIHYTAFTLRRE